MSVLELEKPKQQARAVENQTVKETVQNLLDHLPDDVTWEQLEDRLHMLKTIWESLYDPKQGPGITHEEMKKRVKLWFK